MSHPLIVSYYTPDYEPYARQLRRSVEKLGLRARIEARPSTGEWVQNCARKALFIQEMRREVGEPVLWLDADAVLRRPLYELDGCAADLAVVKRSGWSFSGGQIYFGSGDGADLIVDIWCHYARRFPHIFDQVTLGYAWWDAALQRDISVKWLDTTIMDKVDRRFLKRVRQMYFGKAALLHRQASRTIKPLQTVPEFTNADLPEWWREAAKRDKPFPIDPSLFPALGLSGV
ncbi:hypothetical protein [Chelativorans salis]|uniref:Uncharacterized protein n=1 Tax=Chelativorans salis TaxID=2978478 RepID=A0ABT2LNR5_9HYPH|nr:hypothetical protein [Chelativorans sp. EGI FJ00035]MCT7375313.1 hypothetical protein [Chelativorans sp. EGI FJ00035]